MKNGLRNPTSVAPVAETGSVVVKTLLKHKDDADWALVDRGTRASPYQAVKGTIEDAQITTAPPAVENSVGITALRTQDVTFAGNQLLDVAFVPTHSVPVFGFVRIRFPANTFTFSDKGTATANYIVFAAAARSTNLAVFHAVVTPDE